MGTDGSVFLAVGLPADILLQSPHVTEADLMEWRYLEHGSLWDSRVKRRLPRGLEMIPVGKHDDDEAGTDWNRFLVGTRLWTTEKRGGADPSQPIHPEKIRAALLNVEMGLFELDLINPPKPQLLLCTTYSG